jgi:hypothetical protein
MTMFDVYCPHHRSRVLLGPRSIESLANTAHGVVLRWRCHCGATGTRQFHSRPGRDRSIFDPALGPAA